MGPFSSPLPVAVLISGSGRTLRNLLQRSLDQTLSVDVRLVISSTARAGGLEHARQFGVPTEIVPKRRSLPAEDYSEAVFGPCRRAGVECVVMGGFLKHVLIPADFELRVVNIHPSLIPSFSGPGFYGQRVHQAALDAGVKVSGCTVHFVDNVYDHGPIILQRVAPVEDDDNAQQLAARVFQLELEALPTALQMLAANQLQMRAGRVVVAKH